MSTLLRSQIRCLRCKALIASTFRHDFVSCPCGSVSLDGGRDYCRVLFPAGDKDDWIQHCDIGIDQDVDNLRASHLLAALKVVCRYAPVGSERWLTTRDVRLGLAWLRWVVNGCEEGRLPDLLVPAKPLLADLELLYDNLLIERAPRRGVLGYGWRAACALAP